MSASKKAISLVAAAMVGVLTLTSCAGGLTPTPTQSSTTQAPDYLAEIVGEKRWTYTGDGGEYTVDLTLSHQALLKDLVDDSHPAKDAFHAKNHCEVNMDNAIVVAGLLTVTSVTETKTPPAFDIRFPYDGHLPFIVSIATWRGESASCKRVEHYLGPSHGTELASTLPAGSTASFPIFIYVQRYEESKTPMDPHNSPDLDRIVLELVDASNTQQVTFRADKPGRITITGK